MTNVKIIAEEPKGLGDEPAGEDAKQSDRMAN